MATFRIASQDDVSQLRSRDTVSAVANQIDGKKSFVLRKKGILDYFLKSKGIFVVEDKGSILGYVLVHPVDWMHGISKERHRPGAAQVRPPTLQDKGPASLHGDLSLEPKINEALSEIRCRAC